MTASPRLFGQKPKYAIIWLISTAAAVVACDAGIRAIYASDADAKRSAPAVRAAGPPVTTLAPSPMTTPKPSPHHTGPLPYRAVEISDPIDHAQVNGRLGVQLQGRSGKLGGAGLRIFVLAFNGQYYLSDNGPVLGDDGRWSYLVKPIGAGTRDIGHVFTIIAATVDRACQATLRNSNRDPDGNIAFPVLPDGCVAAAKVDVLKTAY